MNSKEEVSVYDMLNIADLYERVRPGFEATGFRAYANRWLAYVRPDGSLFCLKFVKGTKPSSKATRVALFFDFVDPRQLQLLQGWIEPAVNAMRERRKSKTPPFTGGQLQDFVDCPMFTSWFEPELSKEIKKDNFVHKLYFLHTTFNEAINELKDMVTEAEFDALSVSYGNYATYRNHEWRGDISWKFKWSPPYQASNFEADMEVFNLIIDNIPKYARDVLLPLGLRLTLRDLLDERHFIWRKRYQYPLISRWNMALDVSAALVLGEKEFARKLIETREVSSGNEVLDLDQDAYDLVIQNAKAMIS